MGDALDTRSQGSLFEPVEAEVKSHPLLDIGNPGAIVTHLGGGKLVDLHAPGSRIYCLYAGQVPDDPPGRLFHPSKRAERLVDYLEAMGQTFPWVMVPAHDCRCSRCDPRPGQRR